MTEGNENCCAVIVAAGNSTRMGLEFSKQFVLLNGVPAIIHTLIAFDRAERIHSAVLVCRSEDLSILQSMIDKYKIQKVVHTVVGGSTRQQSVLAGISAAPGDSFYFAIHDGARALITPQEIDSVVEDGIRFHASALAVPVKDTIKIVNKDGFVVSTPERSSLWAVQTPQVFERNLYFNAVKTAKNSNADYTDDCQLAEHAGIEVHLCAGSYTNLKLTTADDIPVAEAIIQKREGSI